MEGDSRWRGNSACKGICWESDKELKPGQDGQKGSEQGMIRSEGHVTVCLLGQGRDFGFYLKQGYKI